MGNLLQVNTKQKTTVNKSDDKFKFNIEFDDAESYISYMISDRLYLLGGKRHTGVSLRCSIFVKYLTDNKIRQFNVDNDFLKGLYKEYPFFVNDTILNETLEFLVRIEVLNKKYDEYTLNIEFITFLN